MRHLIFREHDRVGDKDRSKNRTIELVSGNKVHVNATDPYGLWTIHFDKGPIPKRLEGMFTSYDEAVKAVQAWASDNDKVIKKEIVLSKDQK